jgi:glycosyltransferase involved in cell wall biosynthesis
MPIRRAVSAVITGGHNDSQLIETVSALRDALAPCTEEFEVILVDDGGAEAAGQRIDDLCRDHSDVRSVRHDAPMGLGPSLRDGAAAARLPLILHIDAGSRIDLGGIGRLLDEIDQHDVVLGYRTKRLDPLGRRLASWALRKFAATVFGVYARDCTCPAKLYRRKVLKHVTLHSRGRFVHVEAVAKANVLGYRIGEVALTPLPPQGDRPSASLLAEACAALREAAAVFRRFDLKPDSTVHRDAPAIAEE